MNRLLTIIAALLLAVMPAGAVLKERDLNQTISVLRAELENAFREQKEQMARFHARAELQHKAMVETMQRSDQIALMLYSQKADYTFDLTYACHEATEQYNEYKRQRVPYSKILGLMDSEIVRYKSLLDALTGLSPLAMTETTQKYRDVCVKLVTKMLNNARETRTTIASDQAHYAEIGRKLKKVHDYAQERYQEIQNNIFINGGQSYFSVLKRLGHSIDEAKSDTEEKYRVESINTKDGVRIKVNSQWRGPGVFLFAVFLLFYLIVAAALSSVIMKWLVPKRFRTPEFMKKRVCIGLMGAIIIFALVISVVRLSMGHNNFMLMASGLLIEYAWLVGVILLSLLIRLKGDQTNNGFRCYTPIMLLGFVIIVFRVIFIPNNLVNLIFPPLLLIFTIWQWLVIRRRNKTLPRSDIFYTWISLLIMLVATCASWIGYTLMAVQILIWWVFQLTCIQTITCIFHLLERYEARYLVKKIKGMPADVDKAVQKLRNNQGAYINKTWFFDFVYMALVPVLGVVSVMWSIWWAADVFNLSHTVISFFLTDFIKIPNVLYLSIQKIVLACSLWFIFRYVSYLLKALYKKYRVGRQGNIAGARPNITLANNIISILTWGAYFIICMLMLHIPGGAISIISAGLATGVGFAMKDLLENFFYGISLMTGRIRVGDYIECDGVRGKVESITYQSTQIATFEGSVIAFLNSALFSKNFKNLTKSHGYEFVKIPVGVAYGTDISKVREVLIKEVEKIKGKSHDGRELISAKRDMDVYFESFGDSSVNLFFTCWVLVEERFFLLGRINEAIYNALNKNGIAIPFPQRDVHIIE
ncbi:MAG: mechanosensitive ion channel family protein [Bacteroidaceae bacterium]|nr:mechanosensitive ion channel family protein [Bacteroidaceae bacterium]